jgi:hypothetical protein
MLGDEFQPRQAFRALKMIFYALNAGLLVFLFIGVYLNGMSIPGFSNEVDILTIVNVLLLGSIPLGYTISSRKLEAIKAGDPIVRKIAQYQSAMILRWAMIEGVALFSIVGLILLQDAKQLILFILCVLVFSMNTVTKEKVIKMAKLNPEEARALDELV